MIFENSLALIPFHYISPFPEHPSDVSDHPSLLKCNSTSAHTCACRSSFSHTFACWRFSRSSLTGDGIRLKIWKGMIHLDFPKAIYLPILKSVYIPIALSCERYRAGDKNAAELLWMCLHADFEKKYFWTTFNSTRDEWMRTPISYKFINLFEVNYWLFRLDAQDYFCLVIENV